jgi:hypothetical protein
MRKDCCSHVIPKCDCPTFKTGAVSASLGLVILLAGGPARAQGSGLARTPPIGWNPWYAFGCRDTEAEVRAAVDAMGSNGMKSAGYEHVNLDDCWKPNRPLGRYGVPVQGVKKSEPRLEGGVHKNRAYARGQQNHQRRFKSGRRASGPRPFLTILQPED